MLKSIERIVDDVLLLPEVHAREVNNDRNTRLTLLDMSAFQLVSRHTNIYTLKMLILKWIASKLLADDIVEGLVSAPSTTECTVCALPAQFCLPCRHWMLPAVHSRRQLPISLFHLLWLYDGLEVLEKR